MQVGPLPAQRMTVKRNNGTRSRISRNVVTHPPPFNAAVVVRKTLRFKASGASTGVTITGTNMLDLLCMADTTTSAYRLFSAARVVKIEAWAPMASDLVPVTCSIEWMSETNALFSNPSFLKSDTSMGSVSPAHVLARPPTGALAGMWFGRQVSASLVRLVFPANTLVDLSLELVLQNGETVQAVATSVAGATVGQVYCRALDNAASSLLVPVSYLTI